MDHATTTPCHATTPALGPEAARAALAPPPDRCSCCVPIPEALLCDPDVSADAVRLYAVLARHGVDPASCHPSYARLAELTGRAPRSVQRPLVELEAAGWVERVPRFDDDGWRVGNGFHVYSEPTA